MIKSVCGYCGVGCGVTATVEETAASSENISKSTQLIKDASNSVTIQSKELKNIIEEFDL